MNFPLGYQYAFIYCIHCIILLSTHSLIADQLTDGNNYNDYSFVQEKITKAVIDEIPETPAPGKILDITARNGFSTIQLAQRFPHSQVFALEVNPSFIKTPLLEQEGNKKVTFLPGTTLKNTDLDSYDLIFSSCSFHYLSDQQGQLNHIYRLLKPEGKVVIFFGPDYGSPRFDQVLEDVKNTDRWKTYFSNFPNGFLLVTPEDFIQKVMASGLSWKKLDKRIVEFYFTNREQFTHWLKSFLSEYYYLAEDKRDDFLKELIDHYIEVFPLTHDGSVLFRDYWMIVEAYKGVYQ